MEPASPRSIVQDMLTDPTPRPALAPSFATRLYAGLFVLALAGCGSNKVVSKQIVTTPPEVLATTPAARSASVVYDTPITVDFRTDMDASTMIAGNVLLKQDTQRVPIVAAWDAPTRRLRVYPQVPLLLRRTYTVDLGPGIRSADGAGFGSGGWFFQFTTNSARRPNNSRPRPGAANESPFVMLSWDSTEAGIGNISYEVWAGTDSVAIASRSGTPVATLSRPRLLPTAEWPLGSRIYWAITVVNAATGERLNGAAQSFSTVPIGTVEDSLLVRGTDYGFNYIISGVSPIYPYQFCTSDSIVSGNGNQGWMTFPLSGLPADVRVASARIEMYTFDHDVSRLPSTVLTLWSAKYDWPRPCRVNVQLPDFVPNKDLALATGRQESGRRILFMSAQLAAHVEAAVRRGGFFGFEFVSTARMAYVTPRFLDAAYHPYLKIHYFRTPPAADFAKAP